MVVGTGMVNLLQIVVGADQTRNKASDIAKLHLPIFFSRIQVVSDKNRKIVRSSFVVDWWGVDPQKSDYLILGLLATPPGGEKGERARLARSSFASL